MSNPRIWSDTKFEMDIARICIFSPKVTYVDGMALTLGAQFCIYVFSVKTLCWKEQIMHEYIDVV